MLACGMDAHAAPAGTEKRLASRAACRPMLACV
jgi:hypothetical protein